MRERGFEVAELFGEGRSSGAELAAKMLPFVPELAAGFGDFAGEPFAGDFGGVEVIVTSAGFVGESGKKGGDGGERIGLGLEARELRVMTVACSLAAKDFLGKERFAPGGDEAFGIEVAWVDGPEAHGLDQYNSTAD